MAQPKRDDTTPAPVPIPPPASHLPGGPVGQMHSDLARRLSQEDMVAGVPDEGPGDRLVRFVSVAAGCVALLAAYAGIAFLILR